MWKFIVNGGPVMVPMVLASIVAFAFIIERGLALRRKKIIPSELESELIDNKYHDLEKLVELCDAMPSVLSRLVKIAIEHINSSKSEIVDVLQTRARKEIVDLERGLVVLEVITGIAPLLGLVGTLHGLIKLFAGLGSTALTDAAKLSEGISITLNTTLMGLLIAIPSLIAWVYYSRKIEEVTVEMETLLDHFIRQYLKKRKKV
jgi:biopolymer transport protein ExbB